MVGSDSSTLLLRLVESLVPLAAPPDAQVAHVDAQGETIDELMHDYCDWTYHLVPRRRLNSSFLRSSLTCSIGLPPT